MKSINRKLQLIATFIEIVILLFLQIKLGLSGDKVVKWKNVFLYMQGISFITYIFFVLYLSKYKIWVVNIVTKCLKFLSNFYCEIFIIVFAVYLAFYQIYYAYCENIFISPDSSNYLREATALLGGYGFNMGGPAGNSSWFSKWPIGYPVLIALVSLLTGQNVYLSSKILSIVLVFLGMAFLYGHFKKKSWMLCLIYCNLGFLKIYKYTWSENPFILCFMMYTVLLAEIICNKNIHKKQYFYLGICSFLTFLMRYFGGITLFITGMAIAVYILLYWISEKYRTGEIKGKIFRLIVTDIISAIFMFAYLMLNKIKTGTFSGVNRLEWRDDYLELADNLYVSLKNEVLNFSRLPDFETFSQMNTKELAVVILIITAVLIIITVKQLKKKIDYRVVFIITGVLYCLLFIGVRFYSYMDLFGYRFFAPGTLLIAVGVYGIIEEKIKSLNFGISIFLSALLIVFSVSLANHVLSYDSSNTAYALINNEYRTELKDIPSKGVVTAYDGDIYMAYAMRPDVMINKNEIDTSGEVADWIKEYSYSDFLCVKKSVLEESILNQDSSESFLSLLEEIKEENENKYIIFSTKE